MSEILPICRCCLKSENQALNLHNFSEHENKTESQTIGEYFSELTALLLTEEDLLFSLICKQCWEELKSAHSFRKKCLNNQQEFQRLLSEHKNNNSLMEFPSEPFSEAEKCEENILGTIEEVEVNENHESSPDDPTETLETEIPEVPGNPTKLEKSPKSKKKKKVKRLDCRYCGKVFASRTLCGKHENDFHVRKLSGPSACSYCGKIFPRRVNCMIHEINVHKKQKKYECHFCQKKFYRKYDLAEHLNIHMGIRPHVCDFPGCDKAFYRKIHLTQHKKNMHKAVEEVWPCKYCGSEFRSKYNLGLHVKIHINERPFHCELCNKTFRQKRCLEAHKLTHSKERPWSCEICGANFPAKSTLNMHLKLHRNKENGIVFKCQQCNKDFASEESLRSHKIFHGGTKDFQCIYCELKFYRRYDLKKHLISKHLLNVNFNCHFCQHVFKMSRNFRKVYTSHAETYHKDIPTSSIQEFLDSVYKLKMDELSKEFPDAFQERTRVCQICHLNFVTIQQKESHMITAHKDEQNLQ